MIFDKQNQFCEDQAITATAVSTNVIDLGVDRDIGKGEPIPLLIQVTETFDNLTSLKVDVETDDNEAMASATVLASGTKLLAALTAGEQFAINYIPDGTERYLRLNFTVAGVAPTAGKVTGGIVASRESI